MSEQLTDPARPEQVVSAAADDGAEQSPTVQEAGGSVERSRLASWLPSMLALIALGVSLFVGWQYLRMVGAEGDSNAQLDRALAGLDERLAGLDRELGRLTQTQSELTAELAQRGQRVSRLDDRLKGVEEGLAVLAREQGSPRRELLLAETEQLLRLGGRALELGGDLASARAALASADERLRELDEPGLLPVRNAIAQELEAIAAVQLPDREGYALTLGSLAEAVPRMPLKRPEAASPADDAGIRPAESQGPIDRAWSVVAGAFSNMISVRRTDTEVTPLLAPGEEYFLRRNLELQLAGARLALLDGQTASYRESLRSARNWLASYFDTDDAGVSSALETLQRLEAERIETRLPDISGSLSLLRSLREGSGAGA